MQLSYKYWNFSFSMLFNSGLAWHSQYIDMFSRLCKSRIRDKTKWFNEVNLSRDSILRDNSKPTLLDFFPPPYIGSVTIMHHCCLYLVSQVDNHYFRSIWLHPLVIDRVSLRIKLSEKWRKFSVIVIIISFKTFDIEWGLYSLFFQFYF